MVKIETKKETDNSNNHVILYTIYYVDFTEQALNPKIVFDRYLLLCGWKGCIGKL